MYRHVTMILLMVCAVPAPAAVYEAATAEEANARAPALKPGDELAVRDGTYADWRLEVPAAGAEGRPIIIRPASPGGVLFRRKTAINLKADWIELRGFHFEQCGPDTVVLIAGAGHCRVTDCRFDHCGNPRSTFGHIVEVGERAGDNRVDHCAWEGSKSMSLGLRIRSRETLGVRNRFDHNTFRDIFHLAWNGQEAIQLGQGAPDTDQLEAFTIVEYNLFDNASGDPELISNKSSRNIIRYNVAANCRAELVLRGGNDCLVEGNVLVRNLGGIRAHGSRHTIINNLCASSERTGISLPLGGGNHTQADDCLIANNTVVNCRRMGLAFSPYGSNAVLPKGNRILANLFAGSAGTLLDLNGAADNKVAGNLFWATGGAKVGFQGEGAVAADPRLAGPEGAERPDAAGPAADAAMPMPEVTRDRLGRPRPGGKAPDIGAEEVNATAAPAEPVVLPPVPPPRTAVDPATLKGAPIHVFDPADPMRGLVRAAGQPSGEGKALRLTDAAVWLAEELPADFIAEWEYQAAAFGSRAFVTFAAPGRAGGYTLRFGGRLDNAPDGVISLSKGDPPDIVADGHDTVLPNRSKGAPPDPAAVWYKCRLIKRGGDLRLEVANTPVLVWTDSGRVGGTALGPGAFGIRQTGAGTWRNLGIWRHSGAGQQK